MSTDRVQGRAARVGDREKTKKGLKLNLLTNAHVYRNNIGGVRLAETDMMWQNHNTRVLAEQTVQNPCVLSPTKITVVVAATKVAADSSVGKAEV